MEGSKHADGSQDARLSASRPPGVYYELFFEKKVQPAFRTGVPVFVGFAKRLGEKAQRASRIYHLDRWPQFQHFEPDPQSYLGYAVRGFFENGGEHCVVVPVESCPDGKAEALIDLFESYTAKPRDGKHLGVLDDLEDIDLICVPDAMAPDIRSSQKVIRVQSAVLEHCQRMGDRFAILDGFPGNGGYKPESSAEAKLGVPVPVSHWQTLPPECGGLYYPWIAVKELTSTLDRPLSREEIPCDEYQRLAGLGTSSARSWKTQPPKLVPPCGHIAGIYSRSDARIGVHKAPANELVEDVLKLEIDFTDDELAELNDSGINCLRAIRGGGIRLWGARTLSGQPQWSYVNVRRLFLTLTRWIRKNMNDVVYETNNPDLWDRVRRRLADYCRNLFDQGALKGNSPEQAFYVKCDSETNSREHWEAGELVAEMGLAPSVPMEFIVVRITQNASAATVSGLTSL
jgi:uncharacterized protein